MNLLLLGVLRLDFDPNGLISTRFLPSWPTSR